MANGETPGIGGVPGLKSPKTRMTRAYGHFTKGLSKTTPRNLAKARAARARIDRLFIVPTRKGKHGR